jgi:hypothetical protein
MANRQFNPLDPLGLLKAAHGQVNNMAKAAGLPQLPALPQQKPQELFPIPSRGLGMNTFSGGR